MRLDIILCNFWIDNFDRELKENKQNSPWFLFVFNFNINLTLNQFNLLTVSSINSLKYLFSKLFDCTKLSSKL